jgi:hypothetical protein
MAHAAASEGVLAGHFLADVFYLDQCAPSRRLSIFAG